MPWKSNFCVFLNNREIRELLNKVAPEYKEKWLIRMKKNRRLITNNFNESRPLYTGLDKCEWDIFLKKNVEELKRHVEYLEECQKLYPSKDNFNYLDSLD